jgi:hypothetical protein
MYLKRKVARANKRVKSYYKKINFGSPNRRRAETSHVKNTAQQRG